MSFSLIEYAQSRKKERAEQEEAPKRKFSLIEYAEARRGKQGDPSASLRMTQTSQVDAGDVRDVLERIKQSRAASAIRVADGDTASEGRAESEEEINRREKNRSARDSQLPDVRAGAVARMEKEGESVRELLRAEDVEKWAEEQVKSEAVRKQAQRIYDTEFAKARMRGDLSPAVAAENAAQAYLDLYRSRAQRVREDTYNYRQNERRSALEKEAASVQGGDPSTAPVGSAQDDMVGALRSAQDDTVGALRSAQDDMVGALRSAQDDTGSAAKRRGIGEEISALISSPEEREKYRSIEERFGESSETLAHVEAMTDTEKSTIQYFASSGQYDKVEEYYKLLKASLNKRIQEAQNKKTYSDAYKNPVKGAAKNVMASFATPAAYAANAANTVANLFRDEYVPTDTNTDAFSGAHAAKETSGGVTQRAYDSAGGGTRGEIASLLAGTGLSMANFLSKAPLGATGAMLAMGADTAGQTTLDVLERGGSGEQALLLSTAAGAIEALTEKMPLDNLFRTAKDVGKTGMKTTIKSVLKQSGMEATEEIVSELANTVLDIAVMRENSGYKQYMAELEASEMSRAEAEKEAIFQYFGKNILMAGAGGAISGAAMGGGASAVSGITAGINRNRAGGGFVKTEYSGKLGNKTIRALDAVGRKLGVKISIGAPTGEADGAHDGYYENGEIVIAQDAKNPLEVVLAHEVAHHLKTTAPEEYNAFLELAVKLGGGDPSTAPVGSAQDDTGERFGSAQDDTGETARDEIAARFTQKLVKDTALFERVAQSDKGAARKLIDGVKEFAAKVKATFGGDAKSDTAAKDKYGAKVEELERAAYLWEKMLSDTETAVASGNKKTAGEGTGGRMYSLKSFADGRRFVDVETDQDLFDGLTDNEKGRMATRIIKERFAGKVVGRDNRVFVNGRSATEYGHPSKRISGLEYDAKMRASTELDNLVDAGTNFRTEPDGRDGHIHPKATGDFKYFDTIFKVGNEYFEGRINILPNEVGDLLIDITQIKNITQDISSSYGENPKSTFLRDNSEDVPSSDNTIPQVPEKSNRENETGRDPSAEPQDDTVGAEPRGIEGDPSAEPQDDTGKVAREDAEADVSEKENEEAEQSVVVKLRKNIPELRNMQTVKTLSGKEFEKSEKNLIDQVTEFFKSIGNKVKRNGFGDVFLSKQGVKDDVAHGIGRAKAVTFAAIPEVIEKGKQIDHQKNWKGRGKDSYVFAAPVEINDKKGYVAVVVLRGEDNRFYLHEVVNDEGTIFQITKEGVSEPFKTASSDKAELIRGKDTPSDNSISENEENVKVKESMDGTATASAPAEDKKERSKKPSRKKDKDGKVVSLARSNTIERSGIFSEEELENPELAEENFKYKPVSEDETRRKARERVEAGREEALEHIKNKEDWDGADTDTAFELLKLERADAAESGNWVRVGEIARLIQKRATKAGQEIQAHAKYTRTAEKVIVDAADQIEKSSLVSADDIDLLRELAKRFVNDNGEIDTARMDKALTDTMKDEPKERRRRVRKVFREIVKSTKEEFDKQGFLQKTEELLSDHMEDTVRAQKIMQTVSGAADLLYSIKEDGEASKEKIIELIKRQAAMRGHKISKGTDKRLLGEDFEFLFDTAEKQLRAITEDYIPRSLGQKISTIQSLGQLLQVPTYLTNIISNRAFGVVDKQTANAFGILFDRLISIATKQKTVGYEHSFGHGIREAGKKQKNRAKINASLDIKSEEAGRYGTGKGRTFKSDESRWKVTKLLSNVEKLLAYELNVPDEAQKGRILRSVTESLIPLVESGDMTLEEATETAVYEARYRTFQDDNLPSKIVGELKKVFNLVGTKDFGAGDFICKYTQVAGALIERTLEYSPAGYIKGIYNLGQMAAEGISTKKQRQAALAFARGTMGTGLIAISTLLSNLKIIFRDDDEKDDNVRALNSAEGVVGTKINLGALGRLLKNESTKAKKGDKLLSVDRFEPFNMFFTVGAEIAKAENKSIGNIALTSISGAVKSIRELSIIQTIDEFFTMLEYSDDSDQIALASEIAIFFGESTVGSFIPSAVRRGARAFDNNYRDAYADNSEMKIALRTLESSIPGVRNTLPKKLDNFGHEKTYTDDPVKNFLNAMVMPFELSSYKKSDVSKELERVRKETGSVSIYPPKSAPYSVKYGGEKYILHAEARERYQKMRGNTYYRLIFEALKNDNYKKLNADQQAAVLEKFKEYATDKAKEEYFNSVGVEYERDGTAWEADQEKLEGVKISDFYIDGYAAGVEEKKKKEARAEALRAEVEKKTGKLTNEKYNEIKLAINRAEDKEDALDRLEKLGYRQSVAKRIYSLYTDC